MVVADDFAEAFELAFGEGLDEALFAHGFNEAFGEDGNAVEAAFGAAFDDGADDDVADFIDGDGAAAEFLGDDGEGGGGGLGDAKGEVTGGAAHADDEVPTGGGPGVFHEVTDEVDAVVAGGLVAEGGGGAGQREVVIDGLGDVGDLNLAVAALGDDAGGEGGVIAADGDEGGDAKFFEDAEEVLHLFFGLGGVGAGGAEDGAAAEVDVLDVADGEGPALLGIAGGEPFEAIAEADDFVALVYAFNRGGGDDAVEAGGGTATDQDSQSAFAHVVSLFIGLLVYPAKPRRKIKIR